jgi:AraC-like DNA-binding protein
VQFFLSRVSGNDRKDTAEFVHAQRVAMAKQLLARSKLSVAQLALRVGFLSPPHFCARLSLDDLSLSETQSG